MAENEEELKSLLMKVKEESEKLNIQKMKIMASGHHFMANRWGNNGNSDFIFLGSKFTADGDCAKNLKDACSLEEKLWPSRQHIKKQKHYFANKDPPSQGYDFSSSHVWM